MMAASPMLVLLLSSAATLSRGFRVEVVNRSLTGAPLISKESKTSWAENTLNPSWLPFREDDGGGLFFRVLTAPNVSSYDAVGFVAAEDASGLAYPPVTPADLLPDEGGVNAGADPRAGWRDDLSEFYFTFQIGGADFPGRHSVLSRTSTPEDPKSWKRVRAGGEPMFSGLVREDGTPFLEATTLVRCDADDEAQRWRFDGRKVVNGDGRCLSLNGSPDGSKPVGLVACDAATEWRYDSTTRQLVAGGDCLDADHGVGPNVGLYPCHRPEDKDMAHQRWDASEAPFLRAESGRNGSECLAVREALANDCGTAVWFPTEGASTAYAVATFGELRGGNVSLVSSDDALEAWTYHGEILRTRPGHWDNATLSAGPAPTRLSDGNWLLLYNVDQLWPVSDPAPLPWFGRCALGWAILDGDDVTKVLARAPEPLVYAQLPWEVDGFTDLVVYSDGIKPEGGDEFTVFAGGGDRVIEAFRIKVHV